MRPAHPAPPRRSPAPCRARAPGKRRSGPGSACPAPAVRPAAPARQSRLGRSEMRLMGVATTCTAVVCGLLLLYLAAYAHVTRLGIDQSQARAHLRDNRLRNEMLRAERDRLQSPQHVISAATAQGMTPRGATPVEYIAAPICGDGAGRKQSQRRQGNRGGSRGRTVARQQTAAQQHLSVIKPRATTAVCRRRWPCI